MDRNEYKMMVGLKNSIPPEQETPVGQKFHIGEVVKISRPETWFSKKSFNKNRDRLFEIEYSYKQKFGGDNINSYSLIHLFEDNSSAWFYESELELVKGIEEINEEKDVKEYKRLRDKYEGKK